MEYWSKLLIKFKSLHTYGQQWNPSRSLSFISTLISQMSHLKFTERNVKSFQMILVLRYCVSTKKFKSEKNWFQVSDFWIVSIWLFDFFQYFIYSLRVWRHCVAIWQIIFQWGTLAIRSLQLKMNQSGTNAKHKPIGIIFVY